MIEETSIEEFIQAIQKLPTDLLFKEKWINWLGEYNTPGFYKRQARMNRSAKFAYGRLANPEMLLWLIQAAGVEDDLVMSAKAAYHESHNPNRQSKGIRKFVPWDVLMLALNKGATRHPTQWLQYWKPFQIHAAITEPWDLEYSAGNQLAKVSLGDTVWIVSVVPSGQLITLGPIHVEQISNRRYIKKRFGDDVWQADWYIVSAIKETYLAKYTDLSSITSRLRFQSKDFQKLVLKKGNVSGTQFQTMRKLEPASAKLISSEWNKQEANAKQVRNTYFSELDKLEALDKKRSTLVRLEQKFLRQDMFGSTDIGRCGICGCEYPVSLLVVAHIKPRSKCSDLERRDLFNMMPLCSLGCDSLFEQGFISVDKNSVIPGPNKTPTKDLEVKVKSLAGNQCHYWSQENKKYFDWKAENTK